MFSLTSHQGRVFLERRIDGVTKRVSPRWYYGPYGPIRHRQDAVAFRLTQEMIDALPVSVLAVEAEADFPVSSG